MIIATNERPATLISLNIMQCWREAGLMRLLFALHLILNTVTTELQSVDNKSDYEKRLRHQGIQCNLTTLILKIRLTRLQGLFFLFVLHCNIRITVELADSSGNKNLLPSRLQLCGTVKTLTHNYIVSSGTKRVPLSSLFNSTIMIISSQKGIVWFWSRWKAPPCGQIQATAFARPDNTFWTDSTDHCLGLFVSDIFSWSIFLNNAKSVLCFLKKYTEYLHWRPQCQLSLLNRKPIEKGWLKSKHPTPMWHSFFETSAFKKGILEKRACPPLFMPGDTHAS